MKRWGWSAGLLLASLLVGGVASAQDATVSQDAAKDEPFPLSVSVNAGLRSGAASFISDSEFTQTDYLLLSTGLGLGYQITDELSVSLGGGFSKYLSDNGGQNFQNEGRLQDMSLGLGYGPIFQDEEYTGITLSGGIDFTIPVSDFSQAEGLYTSVSPSLSLSKSFGGLNLSYSLGFSKNFHEYTSATYPLDESQIIARSGGAENVKPGQVAIDGVLSEYSISNSFNLSYRFLEDFNARLGLTYGDSWTYDNGTITEADEFTNQYAVTGRGHAQSVGGSFGVGYNVPGVDSLGLQNLSLSLGSATGGAPLTADNKSLRFPFWDFESPQARYTSFSFGMAASF
jgi:hypothetical protein